MLTSFFGKSNPINYLLLGLYLIVVLFLQGFLGTSDTNTMASFFLLLYNGVLLIFCMLLVDFFIRKNSLTQSNTYGIFCFSTGALLFPIAFHSEVLWGLSFTLLGLRRLFSLHSGRNDVRKLLDASIWFFVASYFYFWSIVWFVPLYLSITSMKELRFRYYFIPPITGICLWLMVTAYYLVVKDSYQWMSEWTSELSLQFTDYGEISLWLGITVLLAFFVWSFFYRVAQLPEVPKKYKDNFILGFFIALTGIIVAILATEKKGAELAFMAPGFALVITSYLERDADFWLREIMMWVLLLLPVFIIFI